MARHCTSVQKYFPEPKAREKYCTRVQCLAISDTDPGNKIYIDCLRKLTTRKFQTSIYWCLVARYYVYTIHVEVKIAIAYTVLELRASRYELLRNGHLQYAESGRGPGIFCVPGIERVLYTIRRGRVCFSVHIMPTHLCRGQSCSHRTQQQAGPSQSSSICD